LEITSTPSACNGSSIISIGRRRIEPSPLIVIGMWQSEAIGVKSRVASPDSPMLSLVETGFRPPRIV